MVPVTIGAQSGKVVVPLPSPALQLLSPTDEVWKETKSRNARMRKGHRIQQQKRTCKTRQAGPPWIRSASFSVLLSEAPWSRNSCHSAYSAWASSKWADGEPA
jgi:hypothetical protein